MKLKFLFVSLVALGAFMIVALTASVSASTIINVNTTTDETNNDGFCSLREAIIASETHLASGAAPGECPAGSGNDTINVASGIYTLASPGQLNVSSSMNIVGAGAALTFIDGNGSVTADRVFDVGWTTPITVTISAVTIENGRQPGYYGGGIHNTGNLTLNNCILTGNIGDFGAGGLWNQDPGVVTLNNCLVSNNSTNSQYGRAGGLDNDPGGTMIINGGSILTNTANSFGGGIYSNGILTVSGSLIRGNTSGADGGGVYLVDYKTATLSAVTISANTAITNGGGIYDAGYLTLTSNSLIQNNTANNGGGLYLTHDFGSATLINSSILTNTANTSGGGLYKDHGGNTPTLNQMDVIGNQATVDGGGLYVYDTPKPVTVNNSTLAGNIAAGHGGGVFINTNGIAVFTDTTISSNLSHGGGLYNNGTLTMTNSTVSGNLSIDDKGGGLYNNTGLAGLYNTTIAHNVSGGAFIIFGMGNSAPGGGIENSAGTVNLRNTIVATNTLETVANALVPNDCDGTLASQGHNLIQTTTGCTLNGTTTGNVTGLDPKLGALADNGGPTLTHALLAGSPAIDAGNPAGCTDPRGAILTTDQRGFPRIVGGDTICDMGAYEYGAMAPPSMRKLYLPLILRDSQ